MTRLIMNDVHVTTGHGGRNHMLSRLRQKYWVVNANSCARKIIGDCVTCRRYNRKVEHQAMADLPVDRITPEEPPFTSVGMDFFGPFQLKLADQL